LQAFSLREIVSATSRGETMRFVFLLLALVMACDSKQTTTRQVEKPQQFKSEKAPYALTLSSTWNLLPVEDLNSYADIAATYQQLLYFIVIPQSLPEIPGVDPPDALALKRASLSVLEEQIQDFVIDRQGPVRIADTTGHSVFASGVSDGAKVKYVTTYVSRGLWGFQIVGWGPSEHETLLVAEIDRVLNSWQFTESKPSSLNIIENSHPAE